MDDIVGIHVRAMWWTIETLTANQNYSLSEDAEGKKCFYNVPIFSNTACTYKCHGNMTTDKGWLQECIQLI